MQPGWTVHLRATPLARPLVDALQEEIARARAYVHLALTFELFGGPWALAAPARGRRPVAGAEGVARTGDLRTPGSHIELEGEVVQAGGRWFEF